MINAKKRFSFFNVMVLLLSIMISSVAYASNYPARLITLPNGDTVLDETATLLFVNGTPITDHEIITQEKSNDLFVPIRFIAQNLSYSVDWDEYNKVAVLRKADKEILLPMNSRIASVNGTRVMLDEPTIVEQGSMYVPLGFVSKNLDATVVQYTPSSWMTSAHTYYYDTGMPVSPSESIIRNHFINIIIDEIYDFSHSVTVEEAKRKAQEICLEGLVNFRLSLRENLISLNEPPDRLDDTFENIETEINRMLYVGEVSRFYKFTIGPYDVLYDRIDNTLFFVIHSSETIIKEVDVHDPELYINVFVVG